MNEYVFLDPSPAPGLTHDEVRELVRSLRARVQELEAELADADRGADKRLKRMLEAEEKVRVQFHDLAALRAANAELAGALQVMLSAVEPFKGWLPEPRLARARNALARHAAGGPVKHPDTERLDWLDARSEPVTYEDAPHATAWHIETEHGERIDLRAAIDAARKEVPNG